MELMQDGVVTLIAGGALALIVRRVAGFVRPSKAQPTCAACASGNACAPAPGASPTPTQHPVVLYRPARHS